MTVSRKRVFSPAAALVHGETALLARVEDLRGISAADFLSAERRGMPAEDKKRGPAARAA